MLADQTTTLSPTGFETLDVGGWQVVVTDGHAVLPEGMTHLPDRAFRNRTSLVSVAFPRSLVSIGTAAFDGCSSLASVTLPATLTSIGDCAFDACEALTTVTFPAGLTSIGDGAFHSCSALSSVTFPASLKVKHNHFAALPGWKLVRHKWDVSSLIVDQCYVMDIEPEIVKSGNSSVFEYVRGATSEW